MKTMKQTALAVSVGLMLAACKPAGDPAPAESKDPATPPAEAAAQGPEVVPAARPPAPPAATVLDSQLGPAGTTWELTKVAVVGQIMTVQFTVRSPQGKSSFETGQKIDDVSVIDDTTSQRYTVLKDDSGRPMASPLNSSGVALSIQAVRDQPVAVWLKFPAVPATSSTVSITVPKVGSFDGIQVQR